MNEKEQLEQEVGKLKGEIERLEILKQTRTQEMAQTKETLRREETDWNNRRSQATAACKTQQERLVALNEQCEAVGLSVGQLRAEVNTAEKRLSDMRVWESGCQEECERLHAMLLSGRANAAWVNDALNRKRDVEAEIEGVEARLRDRVAAERQLGEQQEEQQRLWQERLHEAKRVNYEATKMQEDVQQRADELTAAERQVATTQMRLAEKERELAERERNAEIVRMELNDQAKHVSDWRAALERQESEYQETGVELKQRQDESLAQQERLNSWQTDLEGIAATLAQRQRQLDHNEQLLVTREEKVAELEASNDDQLQKLRERAEDLHARQKAFEKKEKAAAA
jgi:chromosome segregation ATPase